MALPKFNPDATPEEVRKLFEQAREASELLKALSHETRLLILCLLSEGEKPTRSSMIVQNSPASARLRRGCHADIAAASAFAGSADMILFDAKAPG